MLYTVHEYALEAFLRGETDKPIRKLSFEAATSQECAEKALYTAKLSNGRACIGPTGRIVYPDGQYGERAWLVVACTSPNTVQRVFPRTAEKPDGGHLRDCPLWTP